MKELIGDRLRHSIKNGLKDIYWDIYGDTIENPELLRRPKSILFVCKGNVCRSPFAEWLARKISEDKGRSRMVFSSAGLEVSGQLPPPEEAIRAAEDFGVSHASHRSKKITPDAMKASDMVLAMDAGHLKVLRSAFPQFYYRIFLLPLFAPRNGRPRGSYYHYNIPDPYGQPGEGFRECFRIIEECLSGLFTEIETRGGREAVNFR